MFSFLKEKLKGALSIFSKKAEEEGAKKEIDESVPDVHLDIPDLTLEPPTPPPASPKQSLTVSEAMHGSAVATEPPKAETPAQPQLPALNPEPQTPPSLQEQQPPPARREKELSFIKTARERGAKEARIPAPKKETRKEPEPPKATDKPAIKHQTKPLPTPTQTTPTPAAETTTVHTRATHEDPPQRIEQEPTPTLIEPPPPLEVQAEEQPRVETPPSPAASGGFFSRIFGKKEQHAPDKPDKKEPPATTAPPRPELPEAAQAISKEAPPGIEKHAEGFFGRLAQKVVTTTVSKRQFDDLFFNLETAMLENNVAVEVIEKIRDDLSSQIVDKPIRRGSVESTVSAVLKNSIMDLFVTKPIDLLSLARTKKPLIICLFGINGSGKTTTIAKLAQFFLSNNLEPVIAAADTFRAAAIDQLEEHADRLGVKVIKHDYGADAAAVAYDAIQHARSKGKDVVLIDTAGRMQTNINLMDEMKKIVRVAKPDVKVFIGESIAGNDCIEQAKTFNDAIGIDSIILSKADVDEKGGAAISVSYITQKPILYLGVGQTYKDLQPFSPRAIVESLGL